MIYRVELVPAAARQLRKLPRQTQLRIRDAIDLLAENPRPLGSKKLTGEQRTWRIRVGTFRVLYEVQDMRLVVLVIRIAHRKDAY